MSIANLQFSRLFINVIHPLYICKLNLQAAMDKEDCELIADIPSFRQAKICSITR
jgi:hypothetical protein